MSHAGAGVRSRLTAEQRREAILAAAKRVFGQAGYHEATTRDTLIVRRYATLPAVG